MDWNFSDSGSVPEIGKYLYKDNGEAMVGPLSREHFEILEAYNGSMDGMKSMGWILADETLKPAKGWASELNPFEEERVLMEWDNPSTFNIPITRYASHPSGFDRPQQINSMEGYYDWVRKVIGAGYIPGSQGKGLHTNHGEQIHWSVADDSEGIPTHSEVIKVLDINPAEVEDYLAIDEEGNEESMIDFDEIWKIGSEQISEIRNPPVDISNIEEAKAIVLKDGSWVIDTELHHPTMIDKFYIDIDDVESMGRIFDGVYQDWTEGDSSEIEWRFNYAEKPRWQFKGSFSKLTSKDSVNLDLTSSWQKSNTKTLNKLTEVDETNGWQPGQFGKGLVTKDGEIRTWVVDGESDGDPWHREMVRYYRLTVDDLRGIFWIDPNGGIEVVDYGEDLLEDEYGFTIKTDLEEEIVNHNPYWYVGHDLEAKPWDFTAASYPKDAAIFELQDGELVIGLEAEHHHELARRLQIPSTAVKRMGFVENDEIMWYSDLIAQDRFDDPSNWFESSKIIDRSAKTDSDNEAKDYCNSDFHINSVSVKHADNEHGEKDYDIHCDNNNFHKDKVLSQYRGSSNSDARESNGQGIEPLVVGKPSANKGKADDQSNKERDYRKQWVHGHSIAGHIHDFKFGSEQWLTPEGAKPWEEGALGRHITLKDGREYRWNTSGYNKDYSHPDMVKQLGLTMDKIERMGYIDPTGFKDDWSWEIPKQLYSKFDQEWLTPPGEDQWHLNSWGKYVIDNDGKEWRWISDGADHHEMEDLGIFYGEAGYIKPDGTYEDSEDLNFESRLAAPLEIIEMDTKTDDEDPDFNDTRPVLYFEDTGKIYVGNEGTYHGDLYEAIGIQPVVIEGVEGWPTTQNIEGYLGQGHQGWYGEVPKEVTDLLEQTYGVGVTDRGDAWMFEGKRVWLDVPGEREWEEGIPGKFIRLKDGTEYRWKNWFGSKYHQDVYNDLNIDSNQVEAEGYLDREGNEDRNWNLASAQEWITSAGGRGKRHWPTTLRYDVGSSLTLIQLEDDSWTFQLNGQGLIKLNENLPRYYNDRDQAIQAAAGEGLMVNDDGSVVPSIDIDQFEHPDPWMDNEPGFMTFPEQWIFRSAHRFATLSGEWLTPEGEEPWEEGMPGKFIRLRDGREYRWPDTWGGLHHDQVYKVEGIASNEAAAEGFIDPEGNDNYIWNFKSGSSSGSRWGSDYHGPHTKQSSHARDKALAHGVTDNADVHTITVTPAKELRTVLGELVDQQDGAVNWQTPEGAKPWYMGKPGRYVTFNDGTEYRWLSENMYSEVDSLNHADVVLANPSKAATDMGYIDESGQKDKDHLDWLFGKTSDSHSSDSVRPLRSSLVWGRGESTSRNSSSNIKKDARDLAKVDKVSAKRGPGLDPSWKPDKPLKGAEELAGVLVDGRLYVFDDYHLDGIQDLGIKPEEVDEFLTYDNERGWIESAPRQKYIDRAEQWYFSKIADIHETPQSTPVENWKVPPNFIEDEHTQLAEQITFEPWEPGSTGRYIVENGQMYAWKTTSLYPYHYHAAEALGLRNSEEEEEYYNTSRIDDAGVIYPDGSAESYSDQFGHVMDTDNLWNFSSVINWITPKELEPWRPGLKGKQIRTDKATYRWAVSDKGHPEHYDALDQEGLPHDLDYEYEFINRDGSVMDDSNFAEWLSDNWDLRESANELKRILSNELRIVENHDTGSFFDSEVGVPDKTGTRPVVYNPADQTIYIGGEGQHHYDVVYDNGLTELAETNSTDMYDWASDMFGLSGPLEESGLQYGIIDQTGHYVTLGGKSRSTSEVRQALIERGLIKDEFSLKDKLTSPDWKFSKPNVNIVINDNTETAFAREVHENAAPDNTGIRPVVYNPSNNTVYVGGEGQHHFDVVKDSELLVEFEAEGKSADKYDWSSDAFGLNGPLEESGLQYSFIQNQEFYSSESYGPKEKEVQQALMNEGLISQIKNPDSPNWKFTNTEFIVPFDPDDPSSSYKEWRPGLWGKQMTIGRKTYRWAIDDDGNPHHQDAMRLLGHESVTDIPKNATMVNPKGEVGIGLGGMFMFGNQENSDWKTPPGFEPWESGQWGRGFVLKNGEGYHWKVDKSGDRSENRFPDHHYDAIEALNISFEDIDEFLHLSPDTFLDLPDTDDWHFGKVYTQPGNFITKSRPSFRSPTSAQRRESPSNNLASKIARLNVEEISYGTYDLGENGRQPVIYIPELETIFVGTEGATHSSVLQAIDAKYEKDSTIDAQYAVIHDGKIAWYGNPDETAMEVVENTLDVPRTEDWHFGKISSNAFEWQPGQWGRAIVADGKVFVWSAHDEDSLSHHGEKIQQLYNQHLIGDEGATLFADIDPNGNVSMSGWSEEAYSDEYDSEDAQLLLNSHPEFKENNDWTFMASDFGIDPKRQIIHEEIMTLREKLLGNA